MLLKLTYDFIHAMKISAELGLPVDNYSTNQ
jgi:hypothetical protein